MSHLTFPWLRKSRGCPCTLLFLEGGSLLEKRRSVTIVTPFDFRRGERKDVAMASALLLGSSYFQREVRNE